MNVFRLLAIAFVVAQCGGSGSSSSVKDIFCPSGAHPISASVVNHWPDLDPEQYANDQVNSCASLVYYEMLPWNTPDARCDEAHPNACTDPHRIARRAHLRAMVARKIKTVWSAQNFNAAGPRRWTEDMYRQHIISFREDALEADPSLTYIALSPGGEPWAWTWEAVLARARIAREEWPGGFVIADAHANEASCEPYFGGIHYNWLEVHPCSIEQTYRSIRFNSTIDPSNPTCPILTVTDCGPVLIPGEPFITDLTREALILGEPLVYYGYQDKMVNVAAMLSIRSAM